MPDILPEQIFLPTSDSSPHPGTSLLSVPDHELLLSVERVMQSNGPEALAPATYFVQEIKQEARSNRNSIRNQETSHEN